MATPTCQFGNNLMDSTVSDEGSTAPNMGIGLLGDANTILKRKFRFLFGIQYCNSSKDVEPNFVKTASRPSITIEETEVSFLNEVTWFPGKAKWETITVVYYDAAIANNAGLYSWLASVYDFTDPCRNMGSKPADYGGEGHLVMLDGCGNALEKWTMYNMWPTAIKFGDLDYGSSDVCEVELTLRYSQVSYKSFCPDKQPEPCKCTGCE